MGFDFILSEDPKKIVSSGILPWVLQSLFRYSLWDYLSHVLQESTREAIDHQNRKHDSVTLSWARCSLWVMWQELFEVLCQDNHLFLRIRVAGSASPHFTGETKDTGALNNWAKGDAARNGRVKRHAKGP